MHIGWHLLSGCHPLDNQAHAWAEVYLDGIGWVPVEVTAGYSTLIPTPTPTPTPTNTPTPTPTNTPTPTVTPQITNTPAPTGSGKLPVMSPTMVPEKIATATPTPTLSPTPSVNTSELGNEITDLEIEGVKGEEVRQEKPAEPELPPGMEQTGWKEILGKSFLIMVVLVVSLLILLSPATLVDRFFRLEKISHRRIIKVMKQKGNARAIKMLNRAIYRKLCFSGMVKKNCTDAEMEEALRTNYSVVWPEDWDRYMTIVKAAEFSKRDFTDEEVEFCYKIYRDIIY